MICSTFTPIPIEKTNEELVHVIMCKIRNDGFFFEPILIDKDTHIILNGHHRLESIKRLGYTKIPCIEVDYQGVITITTPKGNKTVDKAYLLSKLSPFKTVNFPDLNQTIEKVKIPLTQLK